MQFLEKTKKLIFSLIILALLILSFFVFKFALEKEKIYSPKITNNQINIDFTFRSHSSAAPMPHCIKDVDIEKTDRTPSDFADDFIAFANLIAPLLKDVQPPKR